MSTLEEYSLRCKALSKEYVDLMTNALPEKDINLVGFALALRKLIDAAQQLAASRAVNIDYIIFGDKNGP